MNKALSATMRKILLLQDRAIQLGGTFAECISADIMRQDPRVLLKCKMNSCGHYGTCLMCPPAVSENIDWEKTVQAYRFALLIQQTIVVTDGCYYEIFEKAKPKFAAIILELEKEAFRKGFIMAYGLVAGNCVICENCAGAQGLSCFSPERARPSLEAIGINVDAVAAAAGGVTGFIDGQLTLTGMLLID